MRRKGFTALELGVVLVIICILASVLFPVFSRSRETARSVQCKSNLMQIGLALHLYAQDWGRRFPPQGGADWVRAVYPYIRNSQIFSCPSDLRGWTRMPPEIEETYPVWPGPRFYGYGLSYAYSPGHFADEPPMTRLLWDWAMRRTSLFRHNGGANVLFLGGAVRWVSEGEWRAKGWPMPEEE